MTRPANLHDASEMLYDALRARQEYDAHSFLCRESKCAECIRLLATAIKLSDAALARAHAKPVSGWQS